ncbi:MAG TPA: primosomal protein N' [Vicinamibacterales bacterium]|nr:primosomal protein N' [Vicinamibacterales bacterium]
MSLISVAVPVPFLDLLTYRVPESIPVPPIGARVRVPVGSRVLTGVVVETGVGRDPRSGPGISNSPGAAGDSDARRGSEPAASGDRADIQLKDVLEALDDTPYVPPHVVELCRWTADYYLAGLGDTIAVAMPPGAKGRRSAFKTRRIAAVTAAGADLVHAPDAHLTPKQRAALETVAAATPGLPTSDLRDRGVSADVLSRLAARGLISLRDEQDERDPFERSVLRDVARDTSRQLTGEQRAAFEQLGALADTREFRVALLHGVTGSGKTEIYLRLAERVRQAGRQVLLMVPEIALTPAVAAQFRGAFGDRVAIQHSALSDGERHDQWHRIRRGDVDIVVGTRSAVFTPLERLGLLIVDEEHDGSYKQEEAPRYHGRDVAIVRASRERALVVLGSATPSMESYQNAESGKYARATLERRVLDRPLAAVTIVNMREEYADQGPDVILSRPLVAAIEARLQRQEQILVLLNRRGYATAVFCRQCGDTYECPNCSVSLTVHRVRPAKAGPDAGGRAEAGRHDGRPVAGGHEDGAVGPGSSREEPTWRARCHYCNYSTKVARQCRKCAAPYMEQAGFGTEKVEQQLHDLFPQARIGRVDRDSIRKKGALTSLLSRFAAGELDVLVGTQMIAKGHDFPRVTLVGVISADVGLGLADFRAAERTFQLLTQVAGRAGRGERTGEAIVQTLYPEHYSIQLACRQDYPAFFGREVQFRRGMRYPPLVALVNVVVRGRSFEEAMSTGSDIVRRLEPAAAASHFAILGPAPAPLGRLRGEHRVQFFLKGMRRADLRNALKTILAGMPEVRRRITVDVDPLSVL